MFRSTVTALVAACASCADSAGPVGDPFVDIPLDQFGVSIGVEASIPVNASYAGGFPVDPALFRWRSDDPSIASISGTGIVTGVTEGIVFVFVDAGGPADSVHVQVFP